MDFLEIIINIILEDFISFVALTISIITIYKNRRNLYIDFEIDPDNKYYTLLEHDTDNPFSVAIDNNGRELKNPYNKNFSHFLIAEVIITNNSPNSITVQRQILLDEKNEKIKILDDFNFNAINRRTFKNNQISAWSTKLISSKDSVYKEPVMVHSRVSLHSIDPYSLSPFESKQFKYCIICEKDKEISKSVQFQVFTTIKRNMFLRQLTKLNNIFIEVIEHFTNSTFSDSILRIRNTNVKDYCEIYTFPKTEKSSKE